MTSTIVKSLYELVSLIDSLNMLVSTLIPEAEDRERYANSNLAEAQKKKDQAEQTVKELKVKRDKVSTALKEHSSTLTIKGRNWVEVHSNAFILAAVCSIPVDQLELSKRSLRGLRSADLVFIGDVLQRNETELKAIPNFGKRGLNNLWSALDLQKLYLGMDTSGWVRPSNPITEPKLPEDN